MLLGFNAQTPNTYQLIRTITSFTGETDTLILPDSRGFISTSLLDASETFTGERSQFVLTGPDGEIDIEFLPAEPGVPGDIVLYDTNGEVPATPTPFITGANGLGSQIVATDATGIINRSFIPAIGQSIQASNQLIETNNDGDIDLSFIPRINVPNGMENQIVSTDASGLIASGFIRGTATNNNESGTPIMTNPDGQLDISFLNVTNSNNSEENQFVLTSTGGFINRDFIETIDTNTGVGGAIIALTTSGFIDNSFINFISSADPANRLDSADRPVMTNASGFVDASLVSITASQTSGGTAGQVVSTTTGGTIDPSFISSINAFNGNTGALISTDSTGRIDSDFILTSQTRVANTANTIPATLATGFLSSSYLETTTDVGQVGDFILADAQGMLSPLLIRSTQSNIVTTGAGELVATTTGGVIDNSFIPRLTSRSGNSAGLVSTTSGTGMIDISFLDTFSSGDTDAGKFVITEAGGTIPSELFTTTVGPQASTIVSTGSNGFLDPAILNGVDSSLGIPGAGRPVLTNGSGTINTALINTSASGSANAAGLIPATGSDGTISTTFFSTTSSAGTAGDIFVANADGILDSSAIGAVAVRSASIAAGNIVELNADTFVDISLLNHSATRVADEQRIVSSRSNDGYIDQSYLQTHIVGNTDANRIVVTLADGTIDPALILRSSSPLANTIVAATAGGFIDTAFLDGVSSPDGRSGRPILTTTGGRISSDLLPTDLLGGGVDVRDPDSPEIGEPVITNSTGRVDLSLLRTRSTVSTTATDNANTLILTNSSGEIDQRWIPSVDQLSGNSGELIRTGASGKLDNSFLNVSITGAAGSLLQFNDDGFIEPVTLNGVSSLPESDLEGRPVLTGSNGRISSDLIPLNLNITSIAEPDGTAGRLIETTTGGTISRAFIPSVSFASDEPDDQANALVALGSGGLIDTSLVNTLSTRVSGNTGVGRVVTTNSTSHIDSSFLNATIGNPSDLNVVVLTDENGLVPASRIESVFRRPEEDFAGLLVRTGNTGFISNSIINSAQTRPEQNPAERIIESNGDGFLDTSWLITHSTRPSQEEFDQSGPFIIAPNDDRFIDDSFINAVDNLADIESGTERIVLASASGIGADLLLPQLLATSPATRNPDRERTVLVTNASNFVDLSYLNTANTLTSGVNLVTTQSNGMINNDQLNVVTDGSGTVGGAIVAIAEGETVISSQLLPAGIGNPTGIASPNGTADQFIVTQANGLIDQDFIEAASDPNDFLADDRGGLLYRTEDSGRFHEQLMAYDSSTSFTADAENILVRTGSTGKIDNDFVTSISAFNATNPTGLLVATGSAGRISMDLIPFTTTATNTSQLVATEPTGTIATGLLNTANTASATLTDNAGRLVTIGTDGLISPTLTNPGILTGAATSRSDVAENTTRLIATNADRRVDLSFINSADTLTAEARLVLTDSDGFINTNQIQTTTVGGVEAAEGMIVRLGNSSRTLPTSLMPFPFAQIATGAANVIPLTDTTGNISVTYFNTITIASGNTTLDRNRIVITNPQGTVDGSLTVGGVEDEAIDVRPATNSVGRLVKTNNMGVLATDLTPTSRRVSALPLPAAVEMLAGTPVFVSIDDMGMPTAAAASNASEPAVGITLSDVAQGAIVEILITGLINGLDATLLPDDVNLQGSAEVYLGDGAFIETIPEDPMPGLIIQRLGRRIADSLIIDISEAARVA